MAEPVVLFDLDGTLADTAPDLTGTLRDMLADRDRPAPSPDSMRALVSHGSRALLALGFGFESPQAVPEELRAEYLERYRQHRHGRTRLFDGMAALLASLDRKRTSWGIVTSKPHALTESLLDQLRVYPACLVCPEQVEHTKPHPEPVLLALEILQADPERSVFAGDHRNDLVSGRQAGVQVAATAWGYGLTGEDRPHCDFWASEPTELVDWLAGQGLIDARPGD